MWCQGLIVGVNHKDIVRIKWLKKYLRKVNDEVTEEKLLPSKWNKHVEGSWRMDTQAKSTWLLDTEASS